MVTFKNLMIGITRNLVFFINKSLIQRKNNGFVISDLLVLAVFETLENIMEAIGLCFVGAIQIIGEAVLVIFIQVVNQQIKLLVKGRLWLKVKTQLFFGIKCCVFVETHRRKCLHVVDELVAGYKHIFRRQPFDGLV